MKGDFSRRTFNIKKHYSSVRMQQGRVQIDADWNEQMDIFDHRQRMELADLLGNSGAPYSTEDAFKISIENNNNNSSNIKIEKGRYYVEGLVCENEEAVYYHQQPDYPNSSTPNVAGHYIAYLDVWQRHITSLEDNNIRELALGGADTCTRLQNIAQVKLLPVNNANDSSGEWDKLINPVPVELTPRLVAPRLQNQLYRIEIHKGGTLESNQVSFKWARDNASVSAKIIGKGAVNISTKESTIVLDDTNVNFLTNFSFNDWIEVSNSDYELREASGIFAQIIDIDNNVLMVRWEVVPSSSELNVFNVIRRWDSKPINVTASIGDSSTTNFYLIEDGLEIKFTQPEEASFKKDQYWLIPARAISNNIEWQKNDQDELLPQAPHGVQHYYTKLALLQLNSDSSWNNIVQDLRTVFPALMELKANVVIEANAAASSKTIKVDYASNVSIGADIQPELGVQLKVDGALKADTLLLDKPIQSPNVIVTNNIQDGAITTNKMSNVSTTPAPFKIPLSDKHGRIDRSWLGDRWITSGLTALPTQRRGAATVIVDNVIYVIGGVTNGTNPLNYTSIVEAYDVSNNTWSTKNPLPLPRAGAAVAVVNKIIYLFGGHDGTDSQNTIYKYDTQVQNATWQTVTVDPGTTIPSPYKHGHKAVAFGGAIYLIGGISRNGTVLSYSESVEVYNIANNKFTSGTPMSVKRYEPAVSMFGNKVFVFGGQTSSSAITPTVEMYDYSLGGNWVTKFAMPKALYAHAAATAGGKIYVMGGLENLNPSLSATRQNLIYNPAADTWQYGQEIPILNGNCLFGLVNSNDALYTVGGTSYALVVPPLSVVAVYIPTIDF